MAVLEKEVSITISSNNIKHYEDFNYSIPRYVDKLGRLKVKRGTKVIVKIEHIPHGSDIRLTKICDKCGVHIPNQTYQNILRRRNNDGKDFCNKCGNRKLVNRLKENIPYDRSLENWAKKNNKEYLLKEFSIKNNKRPSEISRATNDKYTWNCFVCGNEYRMIVKNRTNGNQHCPLCSESKGEKRIRKWLNENGIEFESQKEYQNLIGLSGGNLSYDFYIHKQNILIEYQGEFHDGSGNKYTKMKLEVQQEHDKRKREYAKFHNINLLEIWHWDYENIEQILESKLIT